MNKYGAILFAIHASINNTFANDSDLGLLGNGSGCNVTQSTMRKGEIHMEHIPCLMQGAINFLLGIAGTIAVIFIIIGAYKILFGSLSQDKTKGKDTIIMALTGFALSTLSWFIIKILLDNFS